MDTGLLSRRSLSSTFSMTAGSPEKQGPFQWAELSVLSHFGLMHCLVVLPQTLCKLNLPARLGCLLLAASQMSHSQAHCVSWVQTGQG